MVKTRRAIHFQLGGFVAAIVLFLLLSRFFPIVDLVAGIQQRVVCWGLGGAIIYPFLFAGCNVLLLPGGILCIGAGLFFGLWWGFFIVFIGNAIGAAISFALSRWLAGPWFRQKFSKSATYRALEPAVEREGWKIILLTQLHPLFPTSLLNYLYGLTRISFLSYMFWTSIGRAPGLFLYVYLGTLGQFGVNLARGKSHPRIVEYWIWGGAFILTALLLFILSRMAFQAMQRAEEMSPAKSKAADQKSNIIS